MAHTISPLAQRASAQAGEQRFDRGLGRHAERLEEQGRDAELGQHAAVLPRILGRLEGHACERGGAGHGRDREREAAQVLGQAAGMRACIEPGRERRGILRRRCQAARVQQFEQRGRPQAAVEVLVQEHLRHGLQLLRERAGERGRHRRMVVPRG